MLKVIETNILMDDNEIVDHQARVIEVSSWNEYVEMFNEYDGNACGEFKSIHNTLSGNSLPCNYAIERLKYTSYNLVCHLFSSWTNRKSIKLAYLI